LSYYVCGSSPDCKASEDGLRFAVWDSGTSKWWRFAVHGEATSRSGLHSQLLIDPVTKEPTIVFHHATRGAAVVAHGTFKP
jgi:hypothetical protein